MSETDLLNKGDLIKSRWRITQKIGGGGFGQIYQAYDKFRRELVAVKVESNSQARQGIRMEVTVLRRIQNHQHVCELLAGGTSTSYNYMVMTLLGASLSELRRHQSEQSFSLSTTLRISQQILEAIRAVHSIGFLHRDVKPSNFAIGKVNQRRIFILDFGLARKYVDYDHHVRSARAEAGFRGTIRYASINAHKNRELGRHDDLWSFFYMIVEFLIGSLPWSKIKDKESVGHMKEIYDYNRFLTYLPDEFDKFLEHLHQLRYEDEPDYEFLQTLFVSAVQRLGYHEEDPFDWESAANYHDTDSSIKCEQRPRRHHQDDPMRFQQSPALQSFERRECLIEHYDAPFSHARKDPIAIQSPSKTRLVRKQQNTKPQNGTGDDLEAIESRNFVEQMNRPSADTIAQHDDHCNRTDRAQATNRGQLTFISQPFSHTVAHGTASLLSHWSPTHLETFTDDDPIKGNRSHSSRGDERMGSFSGERISSSTRNNSAGRRRQIPHHPTANRALPPKHQGVPEIPFGSYTNSNRRNRNHNSSNQSSRLSLDTPSWLARKAR